MGHEYIALKKHPLRITMDIGDGKKRDIPVNLPNLCTGVFL